MSMKKINTWLAAHIEMIIILFILLGPIFDCVTALSLHLFHTSFTGIMVMKVLFLGILLYDLLFISQCKHRNKIRWMIVAILIYMVMFTIQIFVQKGMDVFLYEGQSMLRTFFFPIVLLVFYNLYLEDRFHTKPAYLCYVLICYLILILLPILTHTGFDSYAYSKVGTIGWFHSSNEVGGILSILFPFLFKDLWNQKKWILFIGMCIIMGIYFSIGTKVPILSILITITIYGLFLCIQMIQSKKWKRLSYLGISLVLAIISLIVVIPKTSFYKNIQIHLDFLDIHSVSDLLTIDKIDHFVFSERIRFLKDTLESYENAPWNQKLLGIGYIENYATDDVNTKRIEMDYYDIFFRHGIIGSIVYFISFLWILLIIVKKINSNFKLEYIVSILLILLLSLFSGHIITAPSVSILVAFILITYLNERKNVDENRIYNGKL